MKYITAIQLGCAAIFDLRAHAFIGISPILKTSPFSKNFLKDSINRSIQKETILSVFPEDYEHVREVFSLIDKDDSGGIDASELVDLLTKLDIDTTPNEAEILFSFLDKDGDGEISFEDEFQPWYETILESTLQNRDLVQYNLSSRRTVNSFDPDLHVSDNVLNRAIECAIAAPNHKLTEPWRFIKVGEDTVKKIAKLNAQNIEDPDKAKKKQERWEKITGWCVVTSKLSEENKVLEMEDYAATCCAIQNFMLSMWVEGVGTKWTSGDITRTQEFADLCGIEVGKEQVVGCIWYGFASTEQKKDAHKKRKKTIEDVLSKLP